MAAPAHLRVTYSGVFGEALDPVEEWQINLNLSQPAQPFAVADDLTPLSASLVAPWTNRIAGTTHSIARLTNVRVASIGSDGKYLRESSGRLVFGETATNVAGSTTSLAFLHPLQVAVAATLRTALDDVCGRGRIFLPAIVTGDLAADGAMTEGARDSVQTTVAGFIGDINSVFATAGFSAQVVVASGGSVPRGIPAANRLVTGVNVGRRLDVQRRRAKSQSEAVQLATAV